MLKQAKEITNLQDLKGKLWRKIQKSDERLERLNKVSDEYRKVVDAYQKVVKSFLDIYRLEASQDIDDEHKDEFSELLDRISKDSQLPDNEKKQLIEIKKVLSGTKARLNFGVDNLVERT